LLLSYGFCLRHNKYNSLGFKVFVNFNKNRQFKEKGEPVEERAAEQTQTAEESDQSKY